MSMVRISSNIIVGPSSYNKTVLFRKDKTTLTSKCYLDINYLCTVIMFSDHVVETKVQYKHCLENDFKIRIEMIKQMRTTMDVKILVILT